MVMKLIVKNNQIGRVVELADTRDLKSLALYGRAGSSPASATNIMIWGIK